MDLLNSLPKITYNGAHAVNLTARIELFRRLVKKFPAFYEYMIKDGERPDTISYDYYGSEDYAWLVLLCANVYNVYTEWPLSYHDFNAYLVKKYGSIESIQNQIAYYHYTGIGGDTDEDIGRKSWKLTETSYLALPTIERAGWTPKTVYDLEIEQNEAKRHIRLLSNIYIDQVDRELEALFSDSQ